MNIKSYSDAYKVALSDLKSSPRYANVMPEIVEVAAADLAIVLWKLAKERNDRELVNSWLVA